MYLTRSHFPFAMHLLAVLLLAVVVRPVSGQEAAIGSIIGSVVDAVSLRPLTGVDVSVERVVQDAAPTSNGRHLTDTRTNAGGAYVVDGLAMGTYLLRVRSPGYHPTTLVVRLTGAPETRVSVGMRVAPIALEPLWVRARPIDSYARTVEADNKGIVRIAKERRRQREHLGSDVRSVSHAEVREAAPLGESDLLRSLQRLPGVSARDDYTAELWTRGGRADQTRIRFDGLPLWNPLHAAGAFSGVSADALGEAVFHPGVQPPEAEGGSAAVLDLRSRPGGGQGFRALSELSVLSGRVALDGDLPADRGGWMIAARRTYWDLFSHGAPIFQMEPNRRMPYTFGDVSARADVRLAGERRLEASGIHLWDRLDGDVPGLVEGSTGRWGSNAARLTLVAPFRGGEVRHTAGWSAFAVRTQGREPCAAEAGIPACGTAEAVFRPPLLDNAINHASLSGTWTAPADSVGVRPLSIGYRLTSEEARFATTGEWPYRRDPSRGAERRGRLRYGSVWLDSRWSPAEHWAVDAGMRADVGTVVQGGGTVRLAPRLRSRVWLNPEFSVSAGAGRSWSYAQALVPTGPSLDGVALAGLFWQLADATTPAVRSDIITVGSEYWVAPAVLASATAYVRRGAGIAVPDPAPGRKLNREMAVPGSEYAQGIELSVRRLAGRLTGSASYTRESAAQTVVGWNEFAAPTARPQALDVTAQLTLPFGFSIGSAFTGTSGSAFTSYLRPSSCAAAGNHPRCNDLAGPFVGSPSAVRTGAYRRADLLLDWDSNWGRWNIGAFLHAFNVTGRNNPAAYRESTPASSGAGVTGNQVAGQPRTPDQQHVILPGLPFVPVFGLRASF